MAVVIILLMCFVEVHASHALSGTEHNRGRHRA